ncbi:hypothetical protein Rhow_004363 [Rhodococcus wratislaviensis]|uniref:Uncharacterized protein n=1 Tax=Rhodococcus wratislaviensis TaxID=44752 RepID=A0A402CAR3_RHOWR|nr:hypothetical protein Rhow_004363 [Rhodococcus wratislaviensis]
MPQCRRHADPFVKPRPSRLCHGAPGRIVAHHLCAKAVG